nr:structural maintenance of chromosomes 1 [Cryptomonas curvata]
MKSRNFSIQSIKIENFKSYIKPSIFCTNEIKSCIMGKNGVGKTSIADALIFAFGGTLKDINCMSIESLFPDFFLNKNFIMSKIGLLMFYNNNFFEIFRTIDITGISEFYLNGINVSFFHFKSIIENINVKYFKEILILKNLPNNSIFLNNQKLITIIQFISNSYKLSKFHLKINLLKNKLIENYFFYFEKIKFILVEKNLLENEKYEMYRINNTKKDFRSKKINCYFLKKFAFLNQYLKLKNIFRKILNKIKELIYRKNVVIHSLNNYFNKNKKMLNSQKKIKKILEYFNISKQKLEQDVNFFFKLRYSYFRLCLLKLTQLFHFRSNKKIGMVFKFLIFLIPNLRYFYHKIHRKISANFKKIFFFFKKNLIRINILQFSIKHTEYFSQKILYISASLSHFNLFTIFIFLCLNNILVTKILLKSNYEKIINNTFFCTISFIFVLIFIREEIKTKKKNLAIPVYVFSNKKKEQIYGIRGMILSMYKPLDSQYKFIVEILTNRNFNIIMVDNLKIALECLEIVKKKKLSKIEFLCRNEINKINEIDINKIFGKFYNLFKFLEYDQYDIKFLIYLIEKKFFVRNGIAVSHLQNTQVLNNFIAIGNNIIENLKYQTITFLPQSYSQKKEEATKKTLLKIKNILIKILNQKIKFSTKEKYFYKILCQNLNSLSKFFLTNYQKILKNIIIFFCANFSISAANCSFFVFLNYFSKSCYFQLILFYSKKEKSKFKNSIRNINLSFIKKTFNLIFTMQKNIKYFNIKKIISNQIGIEIVYFFSIVLLVNCFLIFKSIKVFKEIIKKLKTKFRKILIYLEKFNSLRKNNFDFLTLLFSLIFSKKGILININKKKVQMYINIKYLFLIRKRKKFIPKKKFKNTYLWEIFLEKIKIKYEIDFSIFFLRKFHYLIFNEIINKICKIFGENLKIKKVNKKKLDLLQKRLEFVQKRFVFLKKKLIKNKYQQILIDSRLKKTKKKLDKKFEIFLQIISENVNLIYKEITQTLSNPLGGVAFINFITNKFTKLKKVIYTVIPSSRKHYDIKNLSGGEKTIASFALIIAISTIYKPPIIFADEIDSNLDIWHSEKIMNFLVNWSEKTKIKLYIITLKMKFIILFQNITFIFKNRKGSDFYNLII